MKQIINITSAGESSGCGWSYWSSWLGCQRKALIIEDLRAQGKAATITTHAMSVGTICHRLGQFHETQGAKDYVLKVPQVLTSAAQDARAIFARYRAYYPPGHWGTVIGCEVPIDGDLPTGGLFVGRRPYTGRIDLVLRVHKARHFAAWQAAGVTGIIPGYYIVDYKFFTPPFDAVGYRHSPQFTGYWRIRHAAKKLLPRGKDFTGTLVLGVNKAEEKRPPAEAIFIPPPNLMKMDVLDRALTLAYERYQDAHDPTAEDDVMANVGCCGYGNQRCSFYMKDCQLI